MNQPTINKLVGKYITNLSPEVNAVIKKMCDFRYASRPEGVKPPQNYPTELEKEFIDVLTIALQNRLKYM